MEKERNPYYFNYLSYGSATCRKCRYATKLKSGGYWCRKKYYDIDGLTCFTNKPDQFADIGKKVLPEPAKQ